MFLNCKIKRRGGTKVSIDGTEYHFRPVAPAPLDYHVAHVDNPDHLARLLSIAEAYEIITAKHAAAEVIPSMSGAADAEPDTDDDHAAADDQSDDMDQDDADDADGADANDSAPGPQPPLEDLSDADLAAKFEAVFGRAPNPRAKRETIIERIREEQAAQAAE